MMIVPSLSPLGLIESSEFSANDKKQFLKSSSYSLVVELQRVRVNEGKMASAADTKLEINAAFLGQVQSNFCFFFLTSFMVLGEVVSEPLSKEQMESGEGLAAEPQSNSLQAAALLTALLLFAIVW